MDVNELRKLLNEAKSNEKELGCAVALSKDKKIAVFDVHRTHKGKEVMAGLKAANKDIAEPIRFGTAIVTKEEPKLVRLVLNQPLTGIAKKVAKALKGSGFTKVKIGLEDGTELEGADEEEEEGQTAPKSTQTAPPEPPRPSPQTEPQPDAGELTKRLAALAPRIPGTAGTDDAKKVAWLKLANQANVYIKTNNLRYAKDSIDQLEKELSGPPAPPGGPDKPTTAPPPDVNALARTLAELAKRIPGAAGSDETRKAALLKMAGQANVYLKTNNPKYAADTIEALRKELDAGTKAPGPDLETLRGFGRKWLDTRQTVEDELEKLQATISMTYEGQPQAGAIETSFRTVTAPILRTLDASFATRLEAAGKETDAEKRDALIAQAKQALAGYKSFAATPLIKDLDDNPFVALSLQASLAATIGGLEAALG